VADPPKLTQGFSSLCSRQEITPVPLACRRCLIAIVRVFFPCPREPCGIFASGQPVYALFFCGSTVPISPQRLTFSPLVGLSAAPRLRFVALFPLHFFLAESLSASPEQLVLSPTFPRRFFFSFCPSSWLRSSALFFSPQSL